VSVRVWRACEEARECEGVEEFWSGEVVKSGSAGCVVCSVYCGKGASVNVRVRVSVGVSVNIK
jgi:hypothetical protein